MTRPPRLRSADVLYLAEAAAYLGVCRKTVHMWERRGLLPARRDDAGKRCWPRRALKQAKRRLRG